MLTCDQPNTALWGSLRAQVLKSVVNSLMPDMANPQPKPPQWDKMYPPTNRTTERPQEGPDAVAGETQAQASELFFRMTGNCGSSSCEKGKEPCSTFTCIYTYVYIHIHIYVFVYVYIFCIYIYIYVKICTCKCV